MKHFLLISLMILFSQNSIASTKTHKFIANWNDEGLQYFDMNDGDHLKVTLPFIKGSHPEAQIIDSSQMLSDCKIISIKNTGKSTIVTFELGETNRDDGFNGCVAEISRNLSDDEDGTGRLILEFGYFIND